MAKQFTDTSSEIRLNATIHGFSSLSEKDAEILAVVFVAIEETDDRSKGEQVLMEKSVEKKRFVSDVLDSAVALTVVAVLSCVLVVLLWLDFGH